MLKSIRDIIVQEHKVYAYETSKLRRKNNLCKQRILRSKSQLNQRKQMGQLVQWVDFEKLRIENRQAHLKLQDCNRQLTEAKVVANRQKRFSHVALRAAKSAEGSKRRLEMQCKRKEEQMRVLEGEKRKVESNLETIRKRLTKFRDVTRNFEAPSIKSYMELVKRNEAKRN
ncbi:MAG: hypothetical protein MHMPM18_001011 [Marteilia pararefringens]